MKTSKELAKEICSKLLLGKSYNEDDWDNDTSTPFEDVETLIDEYMGQQWQPIEELELTDNKNDKRLLDIAWIPVPQEHLPEGMKQLEGDHTRVIYATRITHVIMRDGIYRHFGFGHVQPTHFRYVDMQPPKEKE